MQRRLARSNAPGADRVGAIVVAALGTYVVVGTVWWLATRPATALLDSGLLPTVQGWNPTWAWAVAAAAMVVVGSTARAIGPLTASPECTFWVLSTPIDRATLLRPRLLVTLMGAAVAGAAGGRLAAFAGAVEQWAPLTAGAAAGCAGVAAVAVLEQGKVLPAPIVSSVRILFSAVGVAAVVAAVAGAVVPVFTTWTPVVVLSALTAPLVIAALCVCRRITAADLNEGADIAVAMRVSIIGLDLSILTGVADDNAWRRVARCPSRSLPRRRTRALIRSDLLRHLRRPSTFAIVGVVVAATWTVGGAVSPIAAAWTQLAAVFITAVVFSTGFREMSNSRELLGMLGMADRALHRPMMVVPACAAAAVTATTAPFVGWTAAPTLIAAGGACLAAYRLRTRLPTAYDGLILETGVGQLPVDLIRQKLRGPDMLIASAMLLAIVV
ncbi:DUF6297 family protein [Rhodococcus spongiicola]|nr:DUF6297 family protein [Rhodococcus spongiicola]